MRRALTLAGIAAWIMIQVPLVVCDSACAASTTPVFLMSLHGCHDVESDVHAHECCGRDHDRTPDKRESDAPESDEHVVVVAQGLNAGTVVVLPAPGFAASGFVVEREAGADLGSEPAAFDAGRIDGGTSPVPDPVSLSDRLLV